MPISVFDMPIGSAGEWAAAIGTVLAVVAAFVVPLWNERRRQPVIHLRHRPRPGLNQMTAPLDNGETSHWLQIDVCAARGRHTAKAAQVELLSIENLSDPAVSVRHEVVAFDWSAQEGNPQQKDIAPGSSRKIDVGFIRSSQESDIGSMPWHLTIRQQQAGSPWVMRSGVYRLRVILTATDIDARTYEFNVNFDGAWFGSDTIWKHFYLDELQEVRTS